jgi:hypothetical protein
MQESPPGRLAVAAPTGDDPPLRPRWRAAAWRLFTVVVIAALMFGLYWCYLLQARTQATDADGAGMVLQGWDMVHNGNLLLSGWFTSDVSFYTFEVPVDGLVAAVEGLRADVVHVAAAIEYALLVLFAGLVAAGAARDRRSGGREGLIRALVAVGVMVAPGTWQGSGVVLGGPDHIGVGVPVLVTLLVVDRVRPRRWLLAAATVVLVAVLLIWAQLDDPVATLSCALPLAIVCGLSVAAFEGANAGRWVIGWVRRRRGRPAAPPRPRRHGADSAAYDAVLAVVAAASYGLTQLLVRAIWRSGGYYLHAIPAGSQISGWKTAPVQIAAEAENVLILFGANFWVGSQPQTAIAYLHMVCLAVALLGLLVAIACWHRQDRVTRALVVGVLVMLAFGAASPLMIPLGGTHEIAVVLPLGAVLGGRVIGPLLAVRRQLRIRWLARSVLVARVTAGCALAVVGLCLLSALGYAAAQPAAPARYQALANWLAAHKLTSGLSGYWMANITTLDTGGKVHLAPLISQAKYGYLWESKASWFNPDVSSANFIVATTQQTPGSAVSLKNVLFWYSKPAKIYQFQQFSILVYDRNVLATVAQPIPSDLYAPPGLDGEGKTTGEVPPPFIGVRNGNL